MILDHEHWSQNAAEWIAWARTPNHDAFWAYRSSLLTFIGQGEGEALDVGCGEGRVSRLLKECGYRVTATDPVEAFIAASEQAGSADDYKIATAANLPFADDTFDLAIAYNVLMDVEDIPAAVREIRRVLRSSGTLIVSIVHPFTDRGRFAGPDPDAPFVLNDSYFGRDRFEGVEERNWIADALRWMVTALRILHGRAGRRGIGGLCASGAGPQCQSWMGAFGALEQCPAVPLVENSASVRLIRLLRAEHDLEVNGRAGREIEVILRHLEYQNTMLIAVSETRY